MNASILAKLQHLSERYEEIGFLLSDPDIQSNQNKFRELGQEYAQIEPVVQSYAQYTGLEDDISNAQEMLADPEMAELAAEEISGAKQQLSALEPHILILLLPKDPNDERNIYLEIRAGTGGDEASIFSGDLYRMYSRYAENQGWQTEIMNENHGEKGGYKEIICRIKGRNVYSQLKFESGVHRVQRVPETESQGRVHTSACTVAVLAEAEEVDAIDINPSDLRVDTFRASGAGGQHVNKTDSAVRLTHIPTGTVVECQDERSQHKNKARAMSLLQSRILASKQEKIDSERAQDRKVQVGSGDRSERIRTYNYPQNRVTDHRINLTLYKLDEIMTGNLTQLFDPLIQEHNAGQLASLASEDH